MIGRFAQIGGRSSPILECCYGCRYSSQCKNRGGLLMPHPNGIVIHPDAQIGLII